MRLLLIFTILFSYIFTANIMFAEELTQDQIETIETNKKEALKRVYRTRYQKILGDRLSHISDTKKQEILKKIDILIAKYSTLNISMLKKRKILAQLEVLKELFSGFIISNSL